jgi:hypothetical protein
LLQEGVQAPHLQAAAIKAMQEYDRRRVAVCIGAAGGDERRLQRAERQRRDRDGGALHALGHSLCGGLCYF